MLQRQDGVGWGVNLRTGDLNAEPLRNAPPHQGGAGTSSVSNGVTTDYFSIDLFNARQYPQFGLSAYTSIGWESLDVVGGNKDHGLSAFLSVTRTF